MAYILMPIMVIALMLGIVFSDKNAKAFSSYPDISGASLQDPIYDYKEHRYDLEALNILAKTILDNQPDAGSNRDIHALISYIQSNAVGTHGKPIENKDISFPYGQYVPTGGSEDRASDLIWMPVYMSRTEPSDEYPNGAAVLTLYLSGTGGPRSSEETGTFSRSDPASSSGGYTTNIDHLVPSNMYGTSYVRSITLGNGGAFVSYKSDHENSTTDKNPNLPTGSKSHKFLEFLKYTDASGDLTNGYLWEDIVTPKEMLWQKDENYKAAIGDSTTVKIDGADVTAAWKNYFFPNECWNVPANNGGSYTKTSFNYSTKTGYDTWKDDKVWLPSLSEVGTGTTKDSGLNGLWQLTENQRKNYASVPSWLRTANTVYNNGDGKDYSTYTMFCVDSDGTIVSNSLGGNSLRTAIRPAIHLNLSSAIKKLDPPVVVPETVNAVYNGAEQALQQGNITIPESEWKSWFQEGKMNVAFFYDKECKQGAAPINAGEYYMRVTLDDRGLYFPKVPRDVKSTVVKFVIAKAQIGIKWIYEDGYPKGIERASNAKVYDRDIKMGREPVVGIKYRSYGGKGWVKYNFDDLLRDVWVAEAIIKDSDKYEFNYELVGPVEEKGWEKTVTSSFEIGRKKLSWPYFVGFEEGDVESGVANQTKYKYVKVGYAGEQYIQIANANPDYFTVTHSKDDANSSIEYMGVSDLGYLTYRVSGVALYTFTVSFSDYNANGNPTSTLFTWDDSAYDFSKGDINYDDKPRELRFEIGRAELEIEILGLPAEWQSIFTQTFRINIRGIYNIDQSETIGLSVVYTDSMGVRSRPLTPVNGEYTLSIASGGEYTLVITLDKDYPSYYIPSGYKAQRFTVIQTVSTLDDTDIYWQYWHNGKMSEETFDYAAHSTEARAIEFEYDEEFYAFSLTIDEMELHDKYYVKAIYSGDIYVRDAGLHLVTVHITAFYKNVQFEDRDYTVYFRIKPIKLDLSDLEWDYDTASPFSYDGTAKQVMITVESLAKYTGLTATYRTRGNRTDAGDYTTVAVFALAEPYATNYILPVAEDGTSYDGNFSFTCEWSIKKAKLTVEWTEFKTGSSGMLFVPTLKHGQEFVDYIYERQESNGSWTATTSITASGKSEKYRVRAVIKPEYANNYELDNDDPCEFDVPAGKSAVSVHFERNGEVLVDGAEFPYTGEELGIELVVDGGGMSLNELSFRYYSVSSNGARTEINGEPMEVGDYVAVANAKFGTSTIEGTAELVFSIVKADYDPTQIFWVYEHGNRKFAATFDKDQDKWVDEQGREVEFVFEYDGTPHLLQILCLQDFTGHEDDALSATAEANVATKATSSHYTARITFKYNSMHYNDPASVFPDTLEWRIKKALIDYNNVRWGYIDANDAEHDFDFDNDAFTFTRDEAGVVKYKVALIGLPKELQSLISYTTQSLTVENSEPEAGNERGAIGEYLTSFTINGTWSDDNHEEFNSANFPLTIPKLRTWQIVRRNLSKLDYQDGFTHFDNRMHNIIELCNIPEYELSYFVVEITFIDTTKINVYSNYGGYEDNEYMIFHAGTYDIKLYEIFGEDESLVIWDYLRITVEKSNLTATWNDAGSYPVATVLNIYATDMITTKYYNRNDAEVTLIYVMSTDGGEQFYAMACATEDYDKDIVIEKTYKITDKGEKEECEKYYFTYEKFEPDVGAEKLSRPEMVEAFKEYTGSELTFSIKTWETYYSKYLYITNEDDLKQTDIGVYQVVLRFKKGANAYWNFPSETSVEEYNRDSYPLTFEITEPKNWPLDYPVFEKTSQKYTGENITFNITNWVALSKYLTYEVFYKGESLGNNLSFKRGGIYSVVFTIPEGSIGYWKNNVDNPKGTYTVQLSITGDPDEPLELLFPTLNKTSAEYTGNAITFRIVDWITYFSDYLEIVELPEGVTFSGGALSATTIGSYKVKVKIKDDSVYTFVNGEREYTLEFSITMPEGGNFEVPIKKPELDTTEQEYDGTELTFRILNWESIYSNLVTVTCDKAGAVIDGGIIKVTAAGVYTLTITFKDGVKAYWDGTDFSREPVKITFRVIDPDNPNPPTGDTVKKVGAPSLDVTSKAYNGREQEFKLLGITDMNAVNVEGSLVQKDVNRYSITISLKDPSKTTWDDGTTGAKTLYFEIVKAKLPDGTHVGVGNNGKPQLHDEDGNLVTDPDIDFGDLFDVEFTDKDGNPVGPDDLVEGGEYNAKLVPHEDKIRESLEDADDILKDVKERNDAGGWDIVYTPDDEGGGFNPLWFLIGLGCVYAILITIIIILARRRKNMNSEDEDEDEDGEDEDDDDDYDDEY